jgi:microcystin-dependent protein
MANLIPLAIADFETQLTTAISAGDTSFSIASATDDDGNSLPAGKYCFTVNNGSSNKQYLIGQLNSTDVTSVKWVSRQGVETSGAQYSARAGSPVIISDFATIQRVADILRGELTLDGASPIVYDAEPTLADRKELATVGYVLDTVSGGTVTFDEQVITGPAGESIVAGNLVYFKTSDQEWYKTDADTVATLSGTLIGIALGTGSDGVAISGGVQISGSWTTTGLTAGSLYYVSATTGGISTTAAGRPIGIALSTTRLLLTPESPISRQTGVPVGTVFPYAGATAPTHYLLCYGQAVSRATYAELYNILGTTYGAGDASTTFNLPDLRGRVIAGLDNLGGSSANIVTDTDADSLGGTHGTETHTLTTAEMPVHTHTYNINSGGAGGNINIAHATSASESNTGDQINNAGSGDAHNNVQPTIFMSYIIRAL